MQVTVVKPTSGGLGVSFRETKGELRVTGVDVGSAGATGGFKVDDIVCSANGRRVEGNMDAMREVVKSTQGEIKFVVTRKVPTGDAPREPPHAQWEMPPPPCLRTAPRRPPWTACEEAWGSAPPPERRLGLDAPLSPTRPCRPAAD